MGKILEKWCNLETIPTMEPIPLVDSDTPLDPDPTLELAPMLDPDPVIPIPAHFVVIPILIPIPAKNGIITALIHL